MNVYGSYDVLSMFVNDVVCDLTKRDICVEIIRMWIVWGFDLSKDISWLYARTWIHIDEDYQLVKSRKRFIWPCPRFEYELIGT